MANKRFRFKVSEEETFRNRITFYEDSIKVLSGLVQSPLTLRLKKGGKYFAQYVFPC